MGGSSKKQKIGNKYEVGMHLIVCRQADALLAIRANDDVMLWEGTQGQGRVSINKQDAFGGDEREGGFSGSIDVELGGQSQGVNDYLSGVLGSLVSASRGVVGLVYRRPYLSANTARLPKLAHKMLNVSGIHRGWLPDIAVINSTSGIQEAAIYIALDMSESMSESNVNAQNLAASNLVRSLKGSTNSVKVVTFAAQVTSSIERNDCDDQDYEDIALFIEALDETQTTVGGNWPAAISQAPDFFTDNENFGRLFGLSTAIASSGIIGNTLSAASSIFFNSVNGEKSQDRRRVIMVVTDGDLLSTPAAITDLAEMGNPEVFLFENSGPIITDGLVLDNTPFDGVPDVSGNPGVMVDSLSSAFTTWSDMNPVHIIRCLLTDPMRGGTVLEADIGDSFAVVAQSLFDEGFGLSPKFRGVDLVIDDRLEVERHADVMAYRSNVTGKWEIKSIRGDYDVVDLDTLDSSIVMDWSGLTRPRKSEIPNQLTTTFTKRVDGSPGSVTRTNPVGVRRQGRVIKADQTKYPSITTEALAIRACLRDLRFVSKRLWSGTLPLTYLPAGIERGSRVILNEPEFRIDNIIATVSEIRHGDSTDARAWITVTEDAFSSPDQVVTSDFGVVEVDDALPVDNRVVIETPYYLGVFLLGQTEIDTDLASEPDLGRLLLAGAAPNNSHLDFNGGVDSGAGLEDSGVSEFAPYGILTAPLVAQADVNTLTMTINNTLGDLQVNSLAMLGDEIIRIDSIAEVAGELQVTVGRGALDTVPQAHAAGAAFVVISDATPLAEDYIAGQSVNVRLISRTGRDRLSLARAPEDTITFSSRAILPYPPGAFQINASYLQDQLYPAPVLTWVGRDRTIQTTTTIEDHTFANIGPEPGVTYLLRVDAQDNAGVVLSEVFNQNLGAVTTHTWNTGTALPAGTAFLNFKLSSVRGTYESWQAASIRVVPDGAAVAAPTNLNGTVVPNPPTNLQGVIV